MLGDALVRATRTLAIASLIVTNARCSPRESSPALPRAPSIEADRTPAPDRAGARCMDVGARRLCWSSRGDAPELAVVERTLPSGPAPGGGYRCVGEGAARACVPRRALAGPFRCQGPRCEQRFARMPDAGVWDCVDSFGATVCVGGTPPAGLSSPPPIAEGWLCATRQGAARTRAPAHGANGDRHERERVCVELSPDYPEPIDAPWRCEFDARRGGLSRVCTRSAADVVGDPRAPHAPSCDAGRACPRGLRCVEGACAPSVLPRGECWFDEDCAEGSRCVVATCVAGS